MFMLKNLRLHCVPPLLKLNLCSSSLYSILHVNVLLSVQSKPFILGKTAMMLQWIKGILDRGIF